MKIKEPGGGSRVQGRKRASSLELRQPWRGAGWQVSLGGQSTFRQDETRASRLRPGHPHALISHCGCLSSGLLSILWEHLVGRHLFILIFLCPVPGQEALGHACGMNEPERSGGWRAGPSSSEGRGTRALTYVMPLLRQLPGLIMTL